jgi:5-dehydro-4-deoxyglucarate dehydratase
MNAMDPQQLKQTIGSGLLSFPVTHFKTDNSFNEATYRDHLSWMLEYKPAGLFAAGGTGEYFSLTLEEFSTVVAAAASEIAGKVPLLAGCGYGTSMAIQFAKAAEAAGAQGLLLFPPYLVNADQAGLLAHVEAVCKSTKLGVIVYNRDNAVVNDVTLEQMTDRCPNLIGFKDGVGNLELMARIYLRLGDRLTYVGGLPTAETFAAPYLEMGVTTYSSAIFNFLPEWAQQFYAAVRAGDREHVKRDLRDFVMPYIALRDRKKGYAVSIVKAGMNNIGRPAGPVRTPLTDLSAEETETLRTLIGSRR